jgi:hypothetical protein
MKFQQRLLTAAAVVAAAVVSPSARALVSLEDGKDHIFVDGSVEMGYDSNVFANGLDNGSLSYEEVVTTEFTRRAGWIGVNVSASVTAMQFERFTSQNYVDPSLSAEFTKQSGRTTGSITLSVQREDRADVNVNTRDISWNYDAGLNFQYPVIERYSITGTFDYSRANYDDQLLFTNQTVYSSNLYLYYILNDQRDMFIDYRYRLTDEANGQKYVDNSLMIGVSGRVFGPFNGSLQVGYQDRTPYGVAGPNGYNDTNAAGSMTWNITRRIALTANVSQDFSTTANAISIETSSAGFTLQDSISSKAVATLTATGGENRFLGTAGKQAPDSQQRVDQFIAMSAFYSYAFNEHLKLQVGCSYYRNWSNLSFADFPRTQYNLTVSSHW